MNDRRIIFLSVEVIFLSLVLSAAGQTPQGALQTFQIQEHFGVSHPMQIVDFDLSEKVDPAKVHVVNDKGEPVLSQILEGGQRVAVLTDLPAGQSRSWHLRAGPPPQAIKSALQVAETDQYYQISNGLTGVRIPKPMRTPVSPPKDAKGKPTRLQVPAPVQGVLYRDGKWTAVGPNALAIAAKVLTKMQVRFLERGPLMVVVEVSYDVEHGEYVFESSKIPAGPGYYRSTITLQAEQPSILFEEDTDVNITWSLNLYDGLAPTHGRYRGHVATRKEYGYEPDGQALRPGHARNPMDAQVDLRFDRPMTANYTSSADYWRWLSPWDRWAQNTGWYWQLFNSQAGDDANLVGFFAGRASRAIGPGMSGVGIFTRPAAAGGKPQAGITVTSERRAADAHVYPKSRFHWGLFIATKKDLAPPDKLQPINRQMNLHGGFNLSKINRYTLDFPDPPGGYGAIYMDPKAVAAMKKKLGEDKGGPNGKGYHGYLYQAEPTARPLIDMWKDPSGKKLREAIAEVNKTAADFLDALVNRAGIHSVKYGYWHGGLETMRHGIWIDQILADPRTTADERRQIKAAAVLFGSVLWDNDFVPLDNHNGINLGTANMPVQQNGYRHFYALLLAKHPTMIERAKSVDAAARQTLKNIINEHGAEMGCPHYIAASFAPTLNTLLQLKQRGFDDPFASEPRLAKFAEFYLNLLTPPEPRIGGKRGFISVGDSSTEPSELYGVLATGFRDAAPNLSARLMGAWQANGKPHSGFFGTTLLMIDESLPQADPRLGDANFPGYYSVLRHGWGTPHETAVWFINGDDYRDHRHADHGSLVIYALGQPLSIDWGSLYTPQASGAYMHSGVVLESQIGHAWDKDGCSLSGGGKWGSSTPEAFVSFPEGAYARARFGSDKTSWTRAVTIVRTNPSRPVLLIRDTFGGEAATAPKVLTFNFMATGDVETPSGKVHPAKRTHPVREHKGQSGDELPSASAPFSLASGVQRLGFTGKYDLDWDVFLINDNAGASGLIGNWAVTPWGGAVKDKEERQHILRVRGTGAFRTLIVPWKKGQRPADLKVTQNGETITLTAAGESLRVDTNGFTASSRSGPAVQRSFGNR